ncbi:MAG: cupin 2 domain-containing protein [Francisella sp.]
MKSRIKKEVYQENVFDISHKDSNEEEFSDLYTNKNITIEKILSYGQITPIDEPYLQAHNEWVLILEGNVKLKLGDEEVSLQKGESLLIPKNTKHWVTYTHNPTIWLAVHIKE